MSQDNKEKDQFITISNQDGRKDIIYNATKIDNIVNSDKKLKQWKETTKWILDRLINYFPKIFFRGYDIAVEFSVDLEETSFEYFMHKIYETNESVILGYFKQPNIIVIHLPELIYKSYMEHGFPRNKKKCKRYLSSGTKLKLDNWIFDSIVQTCIHELFHAHQYITQYTEKKTNSRKRDVEGAVELEVDKFIISYKEKLTDMMRYHATDSVDLYTKCFYELITNLRSENYIIETLRSTEPNAVRVKSDLAWKYRFELGKVNKRYKKASIEYILAARIAFCSGEAPIEYIKLGIINPHIRELRRMIRNMQDIEYDGIVWKKNGRYVYGNYGKKKGDA